MMIQESRSAPSKFSRNALLRLLAINLAAGAAVTVLLVGGLLALNPGGLRDLIVADRSPGIALALLLGSFFVTFGSAAMGTAIMTAGRPPDGKGPHGGRPARTAEALVRVQRS
jgi:hypothetical protein